MARPQYPPDPDQSFEAMPAAPSNASPNSMPMPAPSNDYADKGGSKMGGGMGAGVEAPENGDVGEAGFKCEGKFPLTGEFWTRDPEHGQA